MADLEQADIVLMKSGKRDTPRAVGDLSFHIGGKEYIYTPEWVNASDLPHLLQLMVALVVQPHVGPLDCKDFVSKHSLWHCFRERA